VKIIIQAEKKNLKNQRAIFNNGNIQLTTIKKAFKKKKY
jgi:hypothetical protein